MAIDLRELADKLPYPKPPNKKMWLIFTIISVSLFILLFILFFKDALSQYSFLIWGLIISFPLLIIGVFLGIRLFIYEQRYEYVRAWNEQYDRTEKTWVKLAQKTICVKDIVYMVDNVCRGLDDLSINNQMLIGSKKFTEYSLPIRYSRIESLKGGDVERLKEALKFLFSALEDQLLDMIKKQSIDLILSVNATDNTLNYASLLKPYQNKLFTNYYLQYNNEGLFFIDEWLDSEQRKTVLYCEVTLHSKPINDSGECITLFLLDNNKMITQPDKELVIHRPVSWQKEHETLEYVIRTAAKWGNTSPKDIEHIWFSGVSDKDRTNVLILMQSLAFSISVENTVNLDWVVGKTQNASGAIAVSCAVEKAKKSGKPQLVIYETNQLQMVIIKAINNKIIKE